MPILPGDGAGSPGEAVFGSFEDHLVRLPMTYPAK
jgi:hypothetical protein